MSSLEQAIQIPVITDRKCGTPEKGTRPAILRMAGGAFLLPAVSRQNMTDEKMSTKDIHEMQDPRDEFRQEGYEKQQQKAPGLQSEMEPVPDAGEQSYHGCGKLRGRKALVTGGDSGIGRAAAIAYAREGADVALNYLPEEQSDAEEVAELIRKEGRNAVLLPGDLSDEAFCQKLVRDALEKLGGLDILALVAGKQVAVEDIQDITTEQLTKTFEVNVFSLFWIAKEALPHLKPGASIITCSSIQAYQPGKNLVDYASTKAAIIAFSRALAKQVASKGIRVNVVAPGPIWTALQVTGGSCRRTCRNSGRKRPSSGPDSPWSSPACTSSSPPRNPASSLRKSSASPAACIWPDTEIRGPGKGFMLPARQPRNHGPFPFRTPGKGNFCRLHPSAEA